jgi:Outer membrane protein beta-barrel domain
MKTVKVMSSGVRWLSLALLGMTLSAQAADQKSADEDRDRGAAVLAGSESRLKSGPYVGAALGMGRNSDFIAANNDGSLNNINADKTDRALQLRLGWQFNDYFAIEAGYLDLGHAHFEAQSDGTGYSWAGPGQADTDVEADGWYGGVRGSMPLSDRWTAFLSLSWYQWKTTETFVDNGFVSTDKNSGGDVRYGAGLQYDLGAKDYWVVDMEVAKTDVDDDGDGVATATLGMSRKF